jgi:hypothetical protein
MHPYSALLCVFEAWISRNLGGQEKRKLFFGRHLPAHNLFEPMPDFFRGERFFAIERGGQCRASNANHQIAQETDAQNGARRRDVYETRLV